MDIKILEEKRGRLMHEAHELIQKPDVTLEDRAKFDAMMKEVEGIESDINRLNQVAKFEAEHRSRTTPPRPAPGEVTMSADERAEKEKRAFDQYLRGGRGSLTHEERSMLVEVRLPNDRETRDVTTATSPTLIPQGFLGVLYEAQKMVGPIASIVGKKVTNNNGAPIKVSYANDTANMASILAEDTTISELDPSFAGPMLYTDTITSKLITVTWQDIADSYFDLPSYVARIIGERFGRYLEFAITNGNGSNINGLLTTYNSGVATASATAIGYSDLPALYGAVDPAYIPNAKWVMSSTTRAYLMGVKDGYGRPLFIDSTTSDAFSTLLGKPVVLNQQMGTVPTNTGAADTPILFGDFEAGYLLRTDGDPSLVTLTERYADKLCNGYFGYQRVGGICTIPGSNPIVALTMAG